MKHWITKKRRFIIMKRILILTAAALMAMTLICSCGYGANDPNQPPLASNSVIVADDSIPDGISPNITGVITSISEVRDGIMILVEIPDAKNVFSDNRYYVTVTAKTVVENKDKVRYRFGMVQGKLHRHNPGICSRAGLAHHFQG